MEHERATLLSLRWGASLLALALVLAGCASATEPTLAEVVSADSKRPTFLFFYTDG